MPRRHIPTELVGLIIGHVDAYLDPKTILACALVCRVWVPFARGEMELVILRRGIDDPRKTLRFVDLFNAPQATFPSFIRRLEISLWGQQAEDEAALLPLLGRFPALKHLRMLGMRIAQLPPVPTLISLNFLSCKLTSRGRFLRSLTNLPALRRFDLTFGNANLQTTTRNALHFPR
ncbi:hypothetical protein FB45DRAFT_922709 [Roridomyces roridus]|uniref:F-box domain-containing protein n=1 Tax=Roridomyces roridus TaxID=1738132 RepID=A0AAD7BN71_9AGAR|nr:hypothetical protein FB45DRAFT_922652 [Roridomyces roridus]KAJ7625956.1 hypothetical protein FB45DRAFT_922709 [Roridomyces roridus]